MATQNKEQARFNYSEAKKQLKSRKQVLKSWERALRRAERDANATQYDLYNAAQEAGYAAVMVAAAEMKVAHHVAVLKNVRRMSLTKA